MSNNLINENGIDNYTDVEFVHDKASLQLDLLLNGISDNNNGAYLTDDILQRIKEIIRINKNNLTFFGFEIPFLRKRNDESPLNVLYDLETKRDYKEMHRILKQLYHEEK